LQKSIAYLTFALAKQMVIVAQLVRASDCGSEGRGFETPHSPLNFETLQEHLKGFFIVVFVNVKAFIILAITNKTNTT
jgi:hypothetical protein